MTWDKQAGSGDREKKINTKYEQTFYEAWHELKEICGELLEDIKGIFHRESNDYFNESAIFTAEDFNEL